ncbi:hypothetical protein Tco_0804877, partial [Tanacetum coccineum]
MEAIKNFNNHLLGTYVSGVMHNGRKMISKWKSGGGNKSLYAQWMENHCDDSYDDDDFDNNGLTNAQMKFANVRFEAQLVRLFRLVLGSDVQFTYIRSANSYSNVEGVVLGVTPDRWYWTLDGSGEFSVVSARKVIDDNRFPEVSNQTRWIKAVPIKVNIYAWKVRMDCLPTRLNISRRESTSRADFPDGFTFGTASSAYQ